MQALVVVDAQNEFSPGGLRPVADHGSILHRINQRVAEARREKRPIAWCKHYNKPHEERAFVPKSWGADLSPGLGPEHGYGPEKIFKKDLHGAFTYTGLQEWLLSYGADDLLLVGFSTHMCISTTAREALSRGFKVSVDAYGTGTCHIEHPILGNLSAEEVRRTALLHLYNIGINVVGLSQEFRAVGNAVGAESKQLFRV